MNNRENTLQGSTVQIAFIPFMKLPLFQRSTVWLVLVFLFFAFTAKSQIVNSVTGTNWNQTTTWDCACIPGPTNDVVIHHAVTISDNRSANSVTITNDAGVNAQLLLTGGTTTIGNGGIQVIGGANANVSDLFLLTGAILIINGDLEFTNTITGTNVAALRVNNTSQLTVNGNFSYVHEATDAVADTRTEIGLNNSSIITITGDLTLTYNSATKNSTLSFLVENTVAITVGGNVNLITTEAGSNLGTTQRVVMAFGTGTNSASSITISGDLTISNSDATAPFAASRNIFETRDDVSSIIRGNLNMTTLAPTAVNRSNRLRILDDSILILEGDLVFSSVTASVTDNRPEIGNVGSSAIFDIKGNVINPGQGRIETTGFTSFLFSGNSAQTIPLVVPNYVNITVDNSSGIPLTLAANTSLTGDLEMINGIINSVSPDRLILSAAATSNGGTATSYVVNGLTKMGGGAITLPIGAGTRWAPIGLSDIVGASDFLTAFEVNYRGSGPANTTTDGTFDHVSGYEYWDIEIIAAVGPPTPPTSADVTFHWKNACGSQIGNVYTVPQDLFIGGFVVGDDRWESLASTINPGSEPCGIGTETGSITTTLTEALLTSNSNYTFIAINPFDNPLPVELISFGVREHAFKEALLEWETASEVNSWKFIVEKSNDGKKWEATGEVKALGTSSTGKEYSVIDNYPFAGTTYYRLVQYDLDETRTYSSIKSLTLGSEHELKFSYYPNPAKDILHINSAKQLSNVDVAIVNANGATVRRFYFSEFSLRQSIPLDDLNTGLYFITLLEDGRKLSSNAIVINPD